jgi:hypothetical protein
MPSIEEHTNQAVDEHGAARHVSFDLKSACASPAKKSSEDEQPLSFASFYYSLKVTKGKDEREDVQKKTFAKWINFQLAKV